MSCSSNPAPATPAAWHPGATRRRWRVREDQSMRRLWKCSLMVCLGVVATAAYAAEPQWRPAGGQATSPEHVAEGVPLFPVPSTSSSSPVMLPSHGPAVILGEPRPAASL